MNKVKPVELHTERLDLRIPKKEDQYYLWCILKQKDVNEYYMPLPSRYEEYYKLKGNTLEERQKRLEYRNDFQNKLQDWNKQEKYFNMKVDNLDKDSNMYTWTIFLKGFNIPIGQITVQPNDEYNNPDIRDIGWFIEPNMQKQELMYEAAQAVLDFMFEKVEIEKIDTSAAVINPGSWKLMEKLGMERTGKNTSPYIDENGYWLSGYKYLITKEMYLEKKNNNKKSR